jgi:hypothetical protein
VVIVAWASPTSVSSLAFRASNCSVVADHVTIRCEAGPAAGSALVWRVEVEGLSNAVPQSSVAAPAVTAAEFMPEAGAVVPHASTLGGTWLRVLGVNFGPVVSENRVHVVTPAGVLATENCSMPVSDAELVCRLPAGTGAITAVTVTALDQSASLATTGLAYAPPLIGTVVPGVLGTDTTSTPVTVKGSGFGTTTQSSQVSVTLRGLLPPGCGSGANGTLVITATSVTVRSDSELVFNLPPSPHVVATWLLDVVVSGQAARATVTTRPPSRPVLTFESLAPNGTHYFLVVTGTQFGSTQGSRTCPGDAVVTISGQPCDALTMLVVR